MCDFSHFLTLQEKSMSNLAIEMFGDDVEWNRKIELMEFVEGIYTPKPKASVLKFQRRKNPTGFGERHQNHEWHCHDERAINTMAKRLGAKAPTVEEGLAEYEATRSLSGYSEANPAYADCAQEYSSFQYCQEFVDAQQQMERYGRFLLNHGYVAFDEQSHYYDDLVSFEFLPRDGHVPQAWKEFQREEQRKEYAGYLAYCEDKGMLCDEAFDDDEVVELQPEYSDTENMFEGDLFFDTDDGEERIWPDDQRYIERQLSGALFDDEECHFPPSQEVRFDTLGAVAARNLQGFGV